MPVNNTYQKIGSLVNERDVEQLSRLKATSLESYVGDARIFLSRMFWNLKLVPNPQ